MTYLEAKETSKALNADVDRLGGTHIDSLRPQEGC